jgi:hypothetical protein
VHSIKPLVAILERYEGVRRRATDVAEDPDAAERDQLELQGGVLCGLHRRAAALCGGKGVQVQRTRRSREGADHPYCLWWVGQGIRYHVVDTEEVLDVTAEFSFIPEMPGLAAVHGSDNLWMAKVRALWLV